MQSINAGFQSLRTLLPRHEGEKLSKVRRFYSLLIFLPVSSSNGRFLPSGRHTTTDGGIHIQPRAGKDAPALPKLPTETTTQPARGRRGAPEEEKGGDRHSRVRSHHGDRRGRFVRIRGHPVADERVGRRKPLPGVRARRRAAAARETEVRHARWADADNRIPGISVGRHQRHLSPDHSTVRKHRDRRADRRHERDGGGVAGRHDRR